MPRGKKPNFFRPSTPQELGLTLILGLALLLASYLLIVRFQEEPGTPIKENAASSIGPKPSAICKDGTLSYSTSRRGTCSWHGGVATWNPSSAKILESRTANPSDSISTDSAYASVLRVIDGDTIEVLINDVDKETVRLLSVDTPETSLPNKALEYGAIADIDCLDMWGQYASSFAEESLELQTIRLEFDGERKRDIYGRLLAYVHLSDGTDFNKSTIELGYARVYKDGNSSRESDYLILETKAMNKQEGLWGCSTD
jgi:micrococcal nuclease